MTYRAPEDLELERKRAALATLETQLLERELERATLDAELRALSSRYFRVVGVLLLEIDELRARIADARARCAPGDATWAKAAEDARRQAAESRLAVKT